DLFEAGSVRRLLGHFERLLEGVVKEPGRRVSSFALLEAAEREQAIGGWNATGEEYRKEAGLHARVSERARRLRARGAVGGGGEGGGGAVLRGAGGTSGRAGRTLARAGSGDGDGGRGGRGEVVGRGGGGSGGVEVGRGVRAAGSGVPAGAREVHAGRLGIPG